MTQNFTPSLDTKISENELGILNRIRRFRLMQICTVSALGLLAALTVARGITFTIFCVGLVCLLTALWMAYKQRVAASAYVLLGSMSIMLFALAVTGAGLFDLAILGYPALLIFSAILGGVGLFMSMLALVNLQCVLLAWLTLNEHISPHIPSLSWAHLVFIIIIFVVSGFSVYILVRDIKRLMLSLQRENAKVQESREQIQHLAHHDPLTNLPNRMYGETLFEQTLQQCQQRGDQLAVLFIDLDNFKPVNDALGHAAGDKLLVQLAERLLVRLTSQQHLIRFGGDEFLILAPFAKNRVEIEQLAGSLIQQCASVFEILQTQVVVSASLGIACAPADGTDFKQLCRKADIAMYKAKENGRNTFYFYDQSLDKDSEDRFRLLQQLRPALAQKAFVLNYQPIVALADNRVTTVEALVRWPQNDGSFVGPDQFIPIAETSGLINELGEWVIQQACKDCASLREQGFSDLRVAVNLSVMQFKDGRLQDIVKDALSEANLPAAALELELTESLLIDETDEIPSQLKALSDMGITIAIDDFGTGYSNLGYLREFNASKLKIDRSFIRLLCQNQQDEQLVKAMINMATSLGLETVAEGVEDQETLAKLTELGCHVGQGYLWSKPISLANLTAVLAKIN